jgi:hypothetical protein
MRLSADHSPRGDSTSPLVSIAVVVVLLFVVAVDEPEFVEVVVD